MTELRGIDLWTQEYQQSHISVEEAEEKVKKDIKVFNEEEKEAISRISDPTLDSEGFKLAGGRKRISIGSGKLQSHKIKEPKVRMDFYKFQKLEQQNQRMTEIRKQFEQDKKWVMQMKQSRSFKPL